VTSPRDTAGPEAAVAPRPAATVMVVRDAPGPGNAGGIQVLMVRRNLRSDFVGGAYVFPGGAVDLADGGAAAEAVCEGRSDAGASTLLGVDAGGLAYWVAVVRECFEEAGVLLARPAGGGPVLSLREPEVEARFARHRAQLNQGSLGMVELCRRESLRLATDAIHYFAHWITPEGAPRRYDTRFFVAAAPPDQIPLHDAAETIAEEWLAPSEALRRHRDGEIELIFPTIRNLVAIDRFRSAAALLEAAAGAADAVPTIEPRVVVDGNGVRILLPGDPGYADAASARPTADPSVFNDAVRNISRRANPGPGGGPPPPGPAEGAPG
jgi:8-oxo-dGTP pyrophosphatase MutT (NUDIX family)